MNKAEVAKIIGDPKRLDVELKAFRKSAELLSSKQAHLIEEYPKRWVAVYRGSVKADGRSLDEVLARVDELNVPRGSVLIRYIDRNLRRMIL